MKKIIVLLMLIISVKGSGQVLQKPAVYGYEFRRLAVDTLFAVPADTFSVPASLQSFPFIARKGTSFYFWNTSTHVWAAFSAAGATPTWQQTLTAGSTLTGTNVIDIGSTFTLSRSSVDRFKLNSSLLSIFSPNGSNEFTVTNTGTQIGSGDFYFATATNLSTQDRIIGQRAASGQLGYVTLGSGLSLSSGVLSNSGVTSTPTWQQTLTAGSTITSDVNITSGTQDINWVGTTGVWDQSMEAFGWTASKSGRNSVLSLTNDSISINPGFGNIHIDTLLNKSNQNALMGWDSTGTDRGQVGYVTLGSGLSLSSGVLNTSGTVPTPISSLTAATGTNSIDNAAFQQQWSWNTLNGAGLYLFSSSTASTGSNHRLLQVSTDGANAAASATTFGALIENDHTGTTSTNIGISASASSGTTNIAGRFEASGGTTSIGGQFSSSGGTTNYGITGSVTGAATTNYGAEFSASGGTTNNALNIAAGALTLNGSAGTSGQVLTSAGANTLPTWTTPSSGGTPGGSDTYIQFNDGGSFGGDAGFTYNKTTNVFSTNNGAYRPTGTISFSDAGAGSVYRSSSDGLVFRAVTGSGYDLLMYDATGNGVFGLEAGTSKLGSTSQIGAGLLGYGSWNAWMNLRGGTTTNASLTIRDGVAPSSPAEGQIWRTTDKIYNVIQTGAATKEFTLNDIALTSGRIPYTTTNGRLTDVSTFVVNSGNVGIGTGSPSALLHVMSTTEQLRVGYDASNYFSTTVGSAGAVAIAATGSSSSFNFSNRLSQKQGADVASASTIALGYDGNTFEITGTTNIELITKTGWQNGSIINLVFSDVLTVTNGVASSGNDITIVLAGASHFETTANDVLTLMLCEVGGTQKWVEVSRSVNYE